MEFKNIILEKKEGIARLTINRPPVNVIDYATQMEINAALEALKKDDEARVLLVRGSGNRAFCAGVEVKDHLGDAMPKMLRSFDRMFRLLRNLGKPSIAVVNGVALGGGCELVAGCDMAVASEKAELGQPEIKLGGLAPVAAALLPKIVGQRKAMELILVGDSFSAKEAERIGLVNKVVPEAELDKAAEDMARKFLGKSRMGVSLSRDAIYRAADSAEFDVALSRATELGIETWQTEDAQEGLKAFLEKRKPVWKDK